ncbi:MAG: hypothetical protein ACREB1_06900 [Sphingomicrobium sp.]
MTIAEKQHPADRLVEWMSPAVLAAAAGWAAWMAFTQPIAGIGAAVIALVIGICAMRVFGAAPRTEAEAGFEPVSFEECLEDDVLLLDDPLSDIEADARVVNLFARDEATPGELVARIADYLGDESRDFVAPTALATGEGQQAPPDASAALHSALANIRASLR